MPHSTHPLLIQTKFAQWRRIPDAILLLAFYCGSIYVASYSFIRLSLCHDLNMPPRTPWMADDPWLNTFPCGRKLDLPRRLTGLWALSSQDLLSFADPESLKWYSQRWWWANTYIPLRYAPFQIGIYFLLGPVVLLCPLRWPDWWYEGGRTQMLWTFRWLFTVPHLLDGLLLGARDRAHMWRSASPALGILMVLWKNGLVWQLPWWHQIPVAIGEALTLMLYALTYEYFNPPHSTWVAELIFGGVCGCVGSIAISYVEFALFERLQEAFYDSLTGAVRCVKAAVHALNLVRERLGYMTRCVVQRMQEPDVVLAGVVMCMIMVYHSLSWIVTYDAGGCRKVNGIEQTCIDANDRRGWW